MEMCIKEMINYGNLIVCIYFCVHQQLEATLVYQFPDRWLVDTKCVVVDVIKWRGKKKRPPQFQSCRDRDKHLLWTAVLQTIQQQLTDTYLNRTVHTCECL